MTTNRVPFPVAPAERPTGPVCVLPVTRTGFQRLVADGRSELLGALPGLAELAAGVRFAGKGGEQLALALPERVLHLVGLGDEATPRGLREAAAQAVGLVPPAVQWSLVLERTGRGAEGAAAAVEGLGLGAYRFRQSAEPAGPTPGPCHVVGEGVAAELVARALARVEGQLLARDLINTPAEQLGPSELVEAARAVAERHGMRCRLLFGDEVAREGFHLVATTGRAADRAPAVAIVESGPEGAAPDLALVGKGVVYDTGGLNLKTGNYMALMRKDMGGAGTVVGALDALGRLGFDGSLLAVLPAAENAIGPAAMRPGDVFESMDGLRVEIGNTDAEGRLLLADALTYARRAGAKRILDLATLTGAARVALGPDLPAVFGTDEELVATLLETSRACDEEVWRMPLVDSYESWIDTPFADVCNSSNDSRAGAITAALFLRRFVRDTPWAHVDLYAWEDRGRPGTPRGANGMLVRTVATAVQKLLAR